MKNMITENVIKRAQKILWQQRDSGRYRLNLQAVLHPSHRAQKKVTRDIIIRVYESFASL